MSSPVRVIDGRPRGDVMRRSYDGKVAMVEYDVPISMGSLVLAATRYGGEVIQPRSKDLTAIDDSGNEFTFIPRGFECDTFNTSFLD